jgi:hypothetical protein
MTWRWCCESNAVRLRALDAPCPLTFLGKEARTSVSMESLVPRSIKANLPWIDAVGSKIAKGLAERYARPIIYRQSGPYNQSKTPHVGIYFNDPILHHIIPVSASHKVDFRFGFHLGRSFSGQMHLGFDMYNPTLTARFLMPNLRTNCTEVAVKLISWLRRHGANGGYVAFAAGDGQKYFTQGDEGPEELAKALGAYASLGRNEDLNWRRFHFSAIVDLPQYQGWDEASLINASGELAEAALRLFKTLDFLYSLLFPCDLGPSRLSGGQNRALKTKQPERRCSWASEEYCEGTVDAAHIKPDRLGGHAVPGNLFWLCQFHHKLLDTYLKATLSLDRPSRRVVASVKTAPPTSTKARGVPLAIWEAIEDKRAWPLPLRPDSIGHLFDSPKDGISL